MANQIWSSHAYLQANFVLFGWRLETDAGPRIDSRVEEGNINLYAPYAARSFGLLLTS